MGQSSVHKVYRLPLVPTTPHWWYYPDHGLLQKRGLGALFLEHSHLFIIALCQSQESVQRFVKWLWFFPCRNARNENG